VIDALTNIISGGAYDSARSSAEKGAKAFDQVNLPTAEELQYQLYELVNNGDMTPEQAKAVMQQQSELGGITLDPKLKQAQMEALTQLQDIGQNKGLTDMDRAQLAQIQGEEAAQSRGAREAILQNAQARGMGGSGLEMLSQMKNQQDSATRQSGRDTQVAGMAQQRALQAIQGAGQLGGQIGAQDFGQQAQIAAAKDAINQFNTANQNKAVLSNQAANNAAQQFNLQKQLEVNKANTDIKNQQAGMPAQAKQQVAQNQLSKAGGQAGAQNAVTQADIARGAANTQVFGSILGAGATAATKSDINAKTDLQDFDAGAFLDDLTPTKYRYKDPADGEGKQVGVMAQEIEPHVPQMVEDTPRGKVVDYSKAGGPIFASLADLHDRLKRLEGGS
jgi:polyhydroxyalkanoate synthesis regulator phasin